MNRALRSVLFTTIVAAFQGHLAAAVVVSEDVPVAGGTAAMAQAAGIDPAPDRARFVAELARVLYNVPDGRHAVVDALMRRVQAQSADHTPQPQADPNSPSDLVPVPLTAAIWSDAVFHRRVPASNLVSAILADRQAALLCYGLASLDDATLAFFVEHPAVLTRLYLNDASAFGAFADGLHIRDGRVLTPGGSAAVPLWEAAVHEKATRPDRFVRELFARGDGRLAYLYDAIGGLDAPHAAFALGTWIPPASRSERFALLVAANSSAYREWHVNVVPFARPIYDIASLLVRVQVEADGSPKRPAGRTLWAAAFDSGDLSDEDAAKIVGRAGDEPVDAAWLAKTIATADMQSRRDRMDQFSLGQRAFTAAARNERAAMLIALRAFGRFRMLVLTLDRIGITNPAVYVAAARHASRLAAVDRRRGFVALAQFQGVLALVAHMARVRTIDAAAAGTLIVSLSAVPVGSDGYNGGVLRWIDRELRPRAAGADDLESGIIALLAGVRAGPAPVRIAWEGQSYHLDLAAAEARRLHLVREKQHSSSLDLAIDIDAQARRLSTMPLAAADLASGIAALKRAASLVRARSKGEVEIAPAGVDVSRDPHEVIATVVDDLAKIQKPSAFQRVAHVVEPLTPVAEAIAADALLSLAYAIDLGDPDGTALLAGNVARRHDFGFALSEADARTRVSWAQPKQDVMPGAPWHVTGSALGLDVALASLALRRIDTSRVTDAPTLTSNERQTFAVSVALMNPAALTDADRDAIAGGIARGRARIDALTTTTFDALADEVALDGWRRRAVRWSLIYDTRRTSTMFSLTEMLSLGGPPAPMALDAWGMAAVVTTGCLCTRMSAPGGWWNLTGRPQLGLLGTTIADVNLRVAVVLHDLGLPAAISRDVLSAAVQDYIDDVRPLDSDDWLTLVRAAQAIPRERIEDYVAAVTAGGPLVPFSSGSAR